jgi:hypothetical protein
MEVEPTFQVQVKVLSDVTSGLFCPWRSPLLSQMKPKYMYVQHTCEKVKQSLYRPGQALRVAGVRGSQISWHWTQEGGNVFSSTRRPPLPLHLPSQVTFLVLIFVIGWNDPRVIARQEGLRQWKIPVTPLWIETTAFWFVAKCLNQLRHRVPYKTLMLFFNQLRTSWHVSQIYPWRHILPATLDILILTRSSIHR